MPVADYQQPSLITVCSDLLEFKSILLKLRDLDEPDGRPLYRYRLEDREFHALTNLLQKWSADVQRLVGLESASRCPGYPALFVLYCAEWWRRYYAGNGFRWEPIFASLNLPLNCLSVPRRGQCVDEGLRAWNLRLARHGGHAYIGNIALQGGLPVRLLAEERNGVGNLISRILRNAKKIPVTIQNLEEWAKSLDRLLPQSYRQAEIFRLIAELTWIILELAKTPGIRASENPIAHLDQQQPDWRNTLPLAIDDEQANQLIARILLEAVRTPVQNRIRIFPVERRLAEAEDDRCWTLVSTVELPETLRAAELAGMFSHDEEDLPRVGELSIAAGSSQVSATLRRMVTRSEYRLSGQPDEIAGCDAASEHIISLKMPDGRLWQVCAPKGNALDDELPWLFAKEESGYRFVRQGGGSVASPSAAIAVNDGWRVTAANDATQFECIGSLEGLGRQVYCVSGEVTVSGPDASYRVRTGNVTEPEQDFDWHGNRLWIDAIRPPMIFRGMPHLYSVGEDGTRMRINGEFTRFAIGTRVPADYGPVEVRYSSRGEIRHRSKMLLLPPNARLKVNPTSARSGSIKFAGWGAIAAEVQEPGISADIELSNGDLTLSLEVEKGVRTPEKIEVNVFWSRSPHPAVLLLPFPARGVRAFDRNGREMPPFAQIAVQSLAGTRLLVCGQTPDSTVDLVLKAEKMNVYRRFRIWNDGSPTEIRLADFRRDIDWLHTIDDNPDSKVILTVEINGNRAYYLSVLPYEAELARGDNSVSIDLSELADKTTAESADAYALALERPGEEPRLLDRINEENSVTWRFDPGVLGQGSWLIYPPPDSSFQFRPTLVTIHEPGESDNRFVQAISIPNRVRRETAIDNLIAELAADFDHPGWVEVNQTARQLGHLPLSRHDLWRRFARSSEAMAALALRYNDFTGKFLTRFASELPFAWDTIAYRDWKAAAGKLQQQCDHLFGETAPQMFAVFLRSRISDLTAEFGSLAYLLGIIQADYFEDARHDAAALRNVIGPASRDYLFRGENSPLMRLRRIHFDDDNWPQDAHISGRAVDEPNIRVYTYEEDLDFQNTVINLPLILAADVAHGTVCAWLTDPQRFQVLEKCRSFDPDWFDEAYNQTIARCYSDGLFDPTTEQ